jgi:hypothetical protein
MAEPKPVTITVIEPGDYTGPTPEPLALIGDIPPAALTVQALTAVPASFADLAAVRTFFNTHMTELKASDYFS